MFINIALIMVYQNSLTHFYLSEDDDKLRLLCTFLIHTLAGLQLGYFLHRAGSDYVIFEKNSIVGQLWD